VSRWCRGMLDIVGNQLIYASEHGSAVACTPAE
jgi:hypothetical protein